MDAIHVKEEALLKEAKHVFKKLMSEEQMKSLYMVDFIQRLGIDHYFEHEIKEALQKQYSYYLNHDFLKSQQLYDLALTFRLLRQGGHHVHADVLFESLKVNKMKLREKYGEDVRSLVALYEATQLSIEGEDILDDASNMCCDLLQAWLRTHQDHHEAIHVANSLQQPLHHGLSRFMDTRSIFLITHSKANHQWACLEELAQINSFIVRINNQNEIVQVSKWWKDLELAQDVHFAGYQPLKWYMWSMACFTDPSFSVERIELTKPISLVYIIDDIFDVYGTLDELILFTDAVNRWELMGTEQLPEAMKMCLRLLFDTTYDFAEKIHKKHGLNPIDILKKSWIKLLKAFLEESQWLKSGHLPKTEEYLKNGIVSTGVHVVLVHAFFLFDHHLTTKTVAMINDFPTIIHSVAKILRLSDDLEGTKSEDQNGLDGSYLDCYMNEHQDVSVEDAQKHVTELISREWKLLNQEILTPNNPFSSAFTNFCLNVARMVPLMYHHRSNNNNNPDNNNNNSSLCNLKDQLKSLVNGGTPHKAVFNST